jgi:hypothetical protein
MSIELISFPVENDWGVKLTVSTSTAEFVK